MGLFQGGSGAAAPGRAALALLPLPALALLPWGALALLPGGGAGKGRAPMDGRQERSGDRAAVAGAASPAQEEENRSGCGEGGSVKEE